MLQLVSKVSTITLQMYLGERGIEGIVDNVNPILWLHMAM